MENNSIMLLNQWHSLNKKSKILLHTFDNAILLYFFTLIILILYGIFVVEKIVMLLILFIFNKVH